MPPDFQMYCGASPFPWCAPGDSVACLGHLFVLDETPRAWYVMEEAECGPRRWQERTPSLLRGGCWRRRGRTLWVWQENMERLPLPGTIPVSSPSMNGLISAVGATGLWLIEPPRNTPEFGARYARNQGASAEPPQFGRLLDRLQFAWERTGTRPYCVALFDPGGGCDAEGRDRLARRCSKFAVFHRRVDAVQWLLGHVPGAPRIRAPMPAPTPEPPQPATDVMTLLGPPSKPLLPALGSPERPLLVRLTDIGGAAARQLLGTLHSRTLSA